jgi:PII-like signaling protein
MSASKKMLVILVDESDTWGEHPLYEGICRKLIQLDAPGATVLAGIMGYGSQHKIHRNACLEFRTTARFPSPWSRAKIFSATL